MINYENAIAEIQTKLGQHSLNEKPSGIANLQNYIGTQYHFYALKNPTVQVIFKKGFTFSNEPMAAQMELYTQFWNQSNCYEIMYLSLMYLTVFSKKNKGLVAHETAKSFLPKIDNWAHSDFLSSIIGRNMMYDETAIYDDLKTLNKSPNLWERRNSLVPLVYHLKNKKYTLNETDFIQLINPLVNDKEYFVQKAIGWLLREFGLRFPNELLQFLYKNAPQISSVAFASATEKISIDYKEQLKKIRADFKKLKI
jgi:3-methyladenine DNA glycosylase AlkD